jgi:hypothetical protein
MGVAAVRLGAVQQRDKNQTGVARERRAARAIREQKGASWRTVASRDLILLVGHDDDGRDAVGVHQHAELGFATAHGITNHVSESIELTWRARQLKGPVMTGLELHDPSEPMFDA